MDRQVSLVARGRKLACLTIGWNAIEGVIAVGAGIADGSLALVGFGLDSFIEVFAGVVVLWQLRGVAEKREASALRLIALTFFVLAGYVVAEGVRDLLTGNEAGESTVGIVLAGVSLVVMPLLAWAKLRTGREFGNPVIMADSTETALCAYLSAILLGGLVLNATYGWWWADTLAAFGIAALAVREGLEAWRGETSVTENVRSGDEVCARFGAVGSSRA
ncbi:MAG: cation transporter [Acidimicrobiia bacterium]|nr:cation transporter [Acidimicrobiia bacterium]